jgi:hypothetical protein
MQNLGRTMAFMGLPSLYHGPDGLSTGREGRKGTVSLVHEVGKEKKYLITGRIKVTKPETPEIRQ